MLGGEGETCGLRMGSGILGFQLMRPPGEDGRRDPFCSRGVVCFGILSEGPCSTMVYQKMPMKPLRATHSSLREDPFLLRRLMGGRDSKPRFPHPTSTVGLSRSCSQKNSQTNPPTTSLVL